MKPTLFALCCVVAVACPLAAQTSNGIPRPTRITTEVGMPSVPGLVNQSQDYYFYNPDSSYNHEVNDVWDNFLNAWVHNAQVYYSNGPDGRLAERLQQHLSNGAWKNAYRRLYTYYTNPDYLDGQSNQDQFQTWNDATGQWQTNSVQTREAWGPGSGALEGTLHQESYEAFSTDGEKIAGGITTYEKAAIPAGIRLLAYTSASYNPNSGVNVFTYRNVYIYNSALSLEFDTTYQYPWNNVAMDWSATPTERTIQTITGQVKVQLRQQLLNNQWVNDTRYTSTTNLSGQLTEFTTESWQDASGAFQLQFRITLTYNPDKSQETVKVFNLDFNNPGAGLYLSQKNTYEYSTFVGVQSPVFWESVLVFPNPASDFVQVSLDNIGAKNTLCTLFDSKGRLSGQVQTTGGNATLSLTGLPAGLYFLRVEQDGAVKTIPVMKQ